MAVAIVAISYWGYSTGRGHFLIQGLVDNAYLCIIACAGLATYAWVLVLPRYIAAFGTLLWMGIFSAVRLPRAPESVQVVRAIMIASIAVMLIMIGEDTFPQVPWASWDSPQDVHWKVPQGLGRMGIRPGDKVAIFGRQIKEYYWARLARVRIVAEIPSDSIWEFWAATPAIKANVIAALRSIGAKVIVVFPEDIPNGDLVGWKRIGTTGFAVYTNGR